MRRPAVSWRRVARRPLLVLAAVVGVGGGLLAAPSAPAAASSCVLAPQLREAVVNQGIAGYTKLVRGKTTVVKAYLAKPACAGIDDRIEMLGAKLTVTFAGVNKTLTTAVVGPVFPELLPASATPSPDAPGDPVFQVPGRDLDAIGDGPSLATFDVRVSYRATTATGVVTTVQDHHVTASAGSPTTSAVFEPRPNAPRILVVPFGNPLDPFSTWWPTSAPSADDALVKALQAYSRMSPVRDGIGDMASSAGVKYVRAPNLLDVRPQLVSGKFCGADGTFESIRTKLETFVSVYNDANPLNPVDKALGVAWHAKSHGPSDKAGCADGYASVPGDHAWTRIVPDATNSLGRGGALIGMELGHTFGAVPEHRDDQFDGYHSVASAGAGLRGVNTATAKYLPGPPSVMKYATSGWNDYNVLHRVEDWEFAQCVLTPLSTATCGASRGTVGTAAATANTYSLAGSTDYTPQGTDVHSFESPSADATPLGEAGALKLVQRDSAEQAVAEGYFDASHETSQHSSQSGSHSHSERGSFNVSVPRAAGADRFELWSVKDPAAPVLLYRRVLNGAPVVRPRHVERVAAEPVNRTAALGGGTSPSLSRDGRLLAYASDGSLELLDLESGTPGASALSGTDPVLFSKADGSTHVAFVRDGDLHLAPVLRPAGGAPSFGAPTVVYRRHAQVDLFGAPAARPTVLGDGESLVVSIAQGTGPSARRDLWWIDLSGGALGPNGTLCQIQPTELARCRRVTDGGSDVEPAAAGPSRVLFRRGGDVRVLDLSGSSPAVLASPALASAAEPAVGGVTAAVRDTASGGIDLVSASSLVERSDATRGADSLPSLAGSRLAFARAGGTRSDVWTVELLHGSTISFEATDDDPQQLRADVYLSCGDGVVLPAFVAEPASSHDEATRAATWELRFDDALACPGGRLSGRVTDGYASTHFDIGLVPGTPAHRAAVYAPAPGSTVLQYDTVALQGEALDALGQPLAGLSYVTTSETSGVTFSRTTPHVPGTPSQLVPNVPGGWVPGATYRVDLVQGTTVLASSRFTAVADEDHDGLPPWRETGPCFAPNADRDPRNAGLDPDGDGEANLVDLTPCGPLPTNVTVRFDPDQLRSSSGTPVTLYLTGSAVDLRAIDPRTVAITEVGPVAVSLPPFKWKVVDATTATAQFDRQQLLAVVDQHGLRGFVPIVVRGHSAALATAFRGFDPDDPVVS